MLLNPNCSEVIARLPVSTKQEAKKLLESNVCTNQVLASKTMLHLLLDSDAASNLRSCCSSQPLIQLV